MIAVLVSALAAETKPVTEVTYGCGDRTAHLHGSRQGIAGPLPSLAPTSSCKAPPPEGTTAFPRECHHLELKCLDTGSFGDVDRANPKDTVFLTSFHISGLYFIEDFCTHVYDMSFSLLSCFTPCVMIV